MSAEQSPQPNPESFAENTVVAFTHASFRQGDHMYPITRIGLVQIHESETGFASVLVMEDPQGNTDNTSQGVVALLHETELFTMSQVEELMRGSEHFDGRNPSEYVQQYNSPAAIELGQRIDQAAEMRKEARRRQQEGFHNTRQDISQGSSPAGESLPRDEFPEEGLGMELVASRLTALSLNGMVGHSWPNRDSTKVMCESGIEPGPGKMLGFDPYKLPEYGYSNIISDN